MYGVAHSQSLQAFFDFMQCMIWPLQQRYTVCGLVNSSMVYLADLAVKWSEISNEELYYLYHFNATRFMKGYLFFSFSF